MPIGPEEHKKQPPTQRLADQVLAVVTSAPKPGIDLLMSMLEAGHVRSSDPVGPDGVGLVEAVLSLAASQAAPAASKAAPSLFETVFSATTPERWKSACGLDVFSRKTQAGLWFPHLLADRATADWSPTSTRANKQSSARRATVDQWVSALLPGMPPEFFSESGADTLEIALRLELPETIGILWEKVGPHAVRSVDNQPVVLSAKSEDLWLRYQAMGLPMSSVVSGQTMLGHFLAAAGRSTKTTPGSFLEAFEHWFVQSARDDPTTRPHIRRLIYDHASRPQSTTTDRWIGLFRAAAPDFPTWMLTRKSTQPVWDHVASSQKDMRLYHAIHLCPDLVETIGANALAVSVFFAVLSQVEQASSKSGALAELKALVQAHSGWPPSDRPWVLQVKNLSFDKKDRAAFLSMLSAHPSGWWGHQDRVEATHRDLFFQMPAVLKKTTDHRLTWAGMVSVHSTPTPWLSLVKAVVSAFAGNSRDLESIDPQSLRRMAMEQGVLSVLKEINMPLKEDKIAYKAWLERLQLDLAVDSPTLAPSSKPRMRL